MARHIPPAIMQLIVRLSRQGRRQKAIAEITGVTQGAVSKILKRFRDTGNANQRPRGHRQRLTTARQDHGLLRMMRKNRFLSSARLRVDVIRQIGRQISLRTINRRLLTAGYPARRPARCPRLTNDYRRRRRQWASCLGPSSLETLCLH